MQLELFAGIHVADYDAALPWYVQLFGAEPTFLAHETEAVWELAEHRFVYVVQDEGRAGRSAVTLFVDDLDARVAAIVARGIEPADRETYGNGVRKVIFRDGDGNEIGFGGGPVADD